VKLGNETLLKIDFLLFFEHEISRILQLFPIDSIREYNLLKLKSKKEQQKYIK